MTEFLHALMVDSEKCTGKMLCVRACPTDAIRLKNGKVSINEALCIDCGECIRACRGGAIKARTDTWTEIGAFQYKVAIVSPALYGQFSSDITPADVHEGLKAIGFDDVYEISVESELINKAIQDYLREYEGPLPVISSTCPVIVRLIQVAYPNMVGQIMPIEPPREIAGREMKRLYSEKLGIPPEKIGAIYISPCPAKIVSIKQPAESIKDCFDPDSDDRNGTTVLKSHLDLAIGIRDIYNPLLAAITRIKSSKKDPNAEPPQSVKSAHSLRLALTGAQSHSLSGCEYISVSQLPNIIQIIEDIEKGKIRNVEFLEAYACTSGCVGGPLTVDERFVARSKLLKLIEQMERDGINVDEEVKARYVKGDYFLRQPCKMRPTESTPANFIEEIRRVKVQEKYNAILPGINCGLCGAPRCEVFASDLARHEAKPSDCPLLSSERVKELRRRFNLPENGLFIEQDSEDQQEKK